MMIDAIPLADGLVLRPMAEDDAGALARAYIRSREHLAPYEPIRPEEFYTAEYHADRYRAFVEDRAAGRAERWLFSDPDGGVFGSITMSGIEYGPFRNARLGYWIDPALGGRGLTTKAVAAVCDYAHDSLGLHRLEAGTLVDNVRSQRVLLKCGFEQIGMSPKHLYINGAWRDHNLYHRILHTDDL
jgi:ribosomal-protein-alanine N-acetyltransferase